MEGSEAMLLLEGVYTTTEVRVDSNGVTISVYEHSGDEDEVQTHTVYSFDEYETITSFVNSRRVEVSLSEEDW